MRKGRREFSGAGGWGRHFSWWCPPSGSSSLGPHPRQISSRGPRAPLLTSCLLGPGCYSFPPASSPAPPRSVPAEQTRRPAETKADGFPGTLWTPPLLARTGASQGVALPVHRVGPQLAPRSRTLEVQRLALLPAVLLQITLCVDSFRRQPRSVVEGDRIRGLRL